MFSCFGTVADLIQRRALWDSILLRCEHSEGTYVPGSNGGCRLYRCATSCPHTVISGDEPYSAHVDPSLFKSGFDLGQALYVRSLQLNCSLSVTRAFFYVQITILFTFEDGDEVLDYL